MLNRAIQTAGSTAIAVLVLLASSVAGQTKSDQDGYLIRLAIDLAAEVDPKPIKLGPDPSNPVAVAYDRFNRAHLAARVAAKAGTPLDPLKPPRTLFINPVVIVALPLRCGDRDVLPTAVELYQSTVQISRWLPVSGAALQKLLPGVPAPPRAIGVQFNDTELRQGGSIRIAYSGPTCLASTDSRQITIPVTTTDPLIVKRALIEMPADQPAPADSITLTLSGVVDLDGRMRYANAPEATTAFGKMALEAANKMQFEPARVNGSPVPWTAGVIVTFGVNK